MTSQSDIQPLPLIMVAPNGARRTKKDHPALPVSIEEIVETAKACFAAGADGIHAHVRDEGGTHVLDAGLYEKLLTGLAEAVPDMQAQITTEAVGTYSPEEQRALVRKVDPEAVSVAVKEMVPAEYAEAEAASFYKWAADQNIAVQHILYSTDDVERFFELVSVGVIPGNRHQLLFVLGRYSEAQESAPENLTPFLDALAKCRNGYDIDWAVCAFGHRETECLLAAIKNGGKARIGFENSLWNRDGSQARDNADRVRELVDAMIAEGLYPVRTLV